MSIFAGVYSRNPRRQVPQHIISALRSTISRSEEDANSRVEYSDDRLFMVKVDVGAYGEPGVLHDDLAWGFVAGAPLMVDHGQDRPRTRGEDLRTIAGELATGGSDALRSSRGQYCAAVYESGRHCLHLVVDKLGVRPVYYWTSPEFVIFSTAMRIIEALPMCTKALSMRGVAEHACFNYSLADRTAYENVFTLHAGEVVSFHDTETGRRRYWRWDELPAANDDYPDLETRIYEIFRDAVRLRLGDETRTASFLSGGLDSRAIVATLRALGASVVSVCYGPPGSQDEAFSADMARLLGTCHTQIRPLPLSESDGYSKASLLGWINSGVHEEHATQRPRLMWSGDGGSCGLGHIYLTEDMVALMRAGDIVGAAGKYLSHNRMGIESRLFKPTVAASMKSALRQGIEEELRSLHPADPGRAIHLYLMLNDQRRHMAEHFENIDLGRVDFRMPFYDSDLLTAILREPIDPFILHRFYVGWLKKFPPAVLEVPWQVYPGHTPCPIPTPEDLSYQWSQENTDEESDRIRRGAIAQAKTILTSKHFVGKYLRKPYVHGVHLLLHAGMQGREYLLHAPVVLHRCWSKTSDSGPLQS